MAKIRKLAFRDVPKLKKMISMLSENENFSFGFESYVPFPINWLHSLLPLRFRFFKESYVSISDKEINGMISLNAFKGNPYSWKINKLFLRENAYDTGRQLVEYVVARYGASGANTFTVRVEDCHDELMELFSKGCGFRVCSSEQLWKMENIKLKKPSLENVIFRPFKNSDAEEVKNLYNDLILPHFRYSLSKTKHEFTDILFCGLNKTTYFKYILEKNGPNPIKGYFSIQTDDNVNFILDINIVSGFNDYYPDVLNFAIGQILARKKDFNLYIINKKYQNCGAKNEEYLSQNGFKCVKYQIVMVKDFYKRIQQEEKYTKPAIVFSDISRNPAFKISINNTAENSSIN